MMACIMITSLTVLILNHHHSGTVKMTFLKRNAPLCGVPGVHRFFRTNENEILVEHRAGYAPKGFNKELYKHQ